MKKESVDYMLGVDECISAFKNIKINNQLP